jgi:RNA polymerase sigma factor (sigma-70 family)
METTASLTAPGPIRAKWGDAADRAARSRVGQPASFDQIVADHQERITRLVTRLLGSSDEVGDVVQEVFLSVLTNLDSFRGESRLSTWLTAIAVNQCRSHQRRRMLRMRNLWQLAKTLAAPPRRQPADSAEVPREVRRAVGRLPARYREPIVLHYFEELPADEIGQVLGISANAVEVRLTRARRKLREMLSRRLGEQ